jgi:PKD repeat protein
MFPVRGLLVQRVRSAAIVLLLLAAALPVLYHGAAPVAGPGLPDGAPQDLIASANALPDKAMGDLLGHDELAAPDEGQLRSLLGAVRFEPNRGQAPEGVLFVGTTPQGLILLERDGIIVPVQDQGAPLHIHFPAATTRQVVGAGAQEGVGHYYFGSDPAAWVRDVPRFAEVRYEELYPGIDLRVYANAEGELEFDHIIAPGADPGQAGFRLGNHDGLMLRDGDLVAHLGGHDVRLKAPVAFQDTPSGRMPVAAAFAITGDDVTYTLGAYDSARRLIIDPVLKYGTYLGTSAVEYGYSVAVHDLSTTERVVYVGGYASSTTLYPTGFPVTKKVGIATGADGYIAKYRYEMATQKVTPEWFARIGGSGTDYVRDVAVDDLGNVIFGGDSNSLNFPVLNPIRIYSGPTLVFDGGSVSSTINNGIVGRLDAAGNMNFGSYYRGTSTDYIHSVAWDKINKRIVAAGFTYSLDLPLVNALDSTFAGSPEGYVLSVSPIAPYATVQFATYLGGSSIDYVYGVAVDATGIYVTGYTYSSNFPVTPGAYDTLISSSADAFVTAYALDGLSYKYSTFIGNTGVDEARSIVTDGAGRVWVGGHTSNPTTFPRCPAACPAGAPPPFGSPSFGYDAFVVSLNPAGNQFLYGSVVGGTTTDYGRSIALDGRNQITLVGQTYSTTFPVTAGAALTTPPIMPAAFAVRFNTLTGALNYATFLGGSSTDDGYAVAADSYMHAFVVGYTFATNFMPITWDALQPLRAGSFDAFLVALGKDTPTPIIRARTVGYPDTLSPTPSKSVLTYEEVVVDGLLSTAGAFPIDASKATWTLYNQDLTVDVVVTGTLNPASKPGWPKIMETNDGTRRVCLKLEDTDPDPTDRVATSCMELKFLNRPPVPTITYVSSDPLQTTKLGTFRGTATDKDGTVVQYRWSFGGYGIKFGAEQTFTFPYGAEGLLPITLTVTDDDGAAGSVTYMLRVEDGPIADFSWPPSTYLPGDPIVFTDLSKTGKDPLRPIWYWTWDWGDGSKPEFYQLLGDRHPAPKVTHAFPKEGWFTVTLTVEDRSYLASVAKKIYVAPRAPIATGESFNTYLDVPLEVDAPGLLANEVHPMGYALTVTSVTQPAKGSVTWTAEGSFVYMPPPGFLGTTWFTYRVTDGLVTTSPVTATSHVAAVPPPTAAFETEVRGHAVVFADQSYPGHYPLAQWLWNFGDGTTSTLQHPVHAYGAAGSYAVTLTVTDAAPLTVGPLSDSTVRLVHILADPSHSEPGSDRPLADAGPGSMARSGDTVTLDGTGSQSPHYGVQYLWRQIAGPPVVLSGSATSRPSFIAPEVPAGMAAVELVFELVVHDGVQYSEPVTVTIGILGTNRAPVAVADPIYQTVSAGKRVVLDAGLSTDADGDTLTYAWMQVAGPAVVFVEDGGPQLTMTAPGELGNMIFQVAVSDGIQEATALAEIRIEPAGGPRARFTADTTHAGQGVVRFADASSGDGLSYWWDFGDGSLPGHAAAPAHTFARSGTYQVHLVVTDAHGREDQYARVIDVQLGAPVLPARSPVHAASSEDATHGSRDEPARPADARRSTPGPSLLLILAAWAGAALAGATMERRRNP